MHERELVFFCRPAGTYAAELQVDFLPVSEFLEDEAACRRLWELVATQFRTRSKFLAVWLGVRFVALHRSESGIADGFLLVNAPVNWQIDYVVVSPEARGRGIASALVTEALNQARRRGAPYVMLTGKPELRSLYAGCGFTVLETREKPAHSR